MKIKDIPASLKKYTTNFTADKRVAAVFKKTYEIFMDIIAPGKCIICGCITNIGSDVCLCCDCRKKLCDFGKIVRDGDKYYAEAVCALPYKDNIRNSMLNYKFHTQKYLFNTFAYVVYEKIKNMSFFKSDSIICPVPIHPLRKRRYNQSALIAKRIGELGGIRYAPDLLIKLENIEPLSKMDYCMRFASIDGCFEFNSAYYDIFDKNIILIDDIYTTGATVNECSKMLRLYGASKVTVVSVCYAESKGEK